MSKIISLQNISKTYKEFNKRSDESVDAIQNISLDLNYGEKMAVTGPSGCGKSTLLNILAY